MSRFALTTLAICLLVSFAQAADKKNVVLIISDDAGWADYGFMRAADPAADPNKGAVPTPNLDRLAGQGVTFTNAYTASVCSPSRAMITTGQYGSRFGYSTNIGGNLNAIDTVTNVEGLPTSAVTIWERMQTVGYDTAAVGKWHIGAHADGSAELGNRPHNQGVEHFDGLWGGSRGYFAENGTTGAQALRRTISDGAGGVVSNAINESDYTGQYVTDVFGDQSVDYIRDKATTDTDPFFLYTSFTAPHTPMQATASDLAYIDSLNVSNFTGQRRTYAAMQYAMDRNVGKILDALEDPNGDGNTSDSIADDTLLLFINDNGGDCCDSSPNSSDNGDLRHGKGSQFEGGMRVPMIVAGAGVNSSAWGTVSPDLVHAIDLVPTAFSGAGEGTFGPGDVIDGANLLPYINGTAAGVAHDDLFISRYSNQQSAVRKGAWKYMYQNGTGYQLYNLDNDIDESNNVVNSPANAATVEEMHQLLASYHVQMDKPRHDNNASSTNQFDHFQFREQAFANASFSSANAWENSDNPGAPHTATFRDSYADNRMTFRAKSGDSYSVTNDLSSVGGFAYMSNRITLASSSTALAGEHSATIGGLPIMMTSTRDGSGPIIDFDAMDANPETFTFNVAADIEIYDDLTIQGDSNQLYVFAGQIREFRSGRNLVKTGAANVKFDGGIDVSGDIDLGGGKVAFTEGTLRGNLIARTGVSLQVGPIGITPSSNSGGGGTPLEIVTAGLDLNYDASLDISGDATWFDSADLPNNLGFGTSASVNAVSSTSFPKLTSTYSIPVTGGASGLNNYFEASGPRSRSDGTFEVVFNVTNDSAGSDQVLFEAGGASRGMALVLNDDVLTFNVDGDASDINLTASLSEGWHHAVGVIDLESGTDSISLYLNNQLIGSIDGQTIDDWAGGNTTGLGAGSSSVTGVSSGTGNSFHGDIAIARYYSDTAFGTSEVNQNYQWLLEASPSSTGEPAVTLAVDGDFTLEAGTSLELDLLNVMSFDQVDATGAISLNGELVVEASEGFSASLGEIFQIVSGSTLSGEFASADLPSLPSGMMWQLQYTQSEALLFLTLSGDYNGDGLVNAADYTVWRDSKGEQVSPGVGADGDGDGTITNADLLVWQQNYGLEVPANGTLANTASRTVPEPSTITATVIGSLLLSYRVRQTSAQEHLKGIVQ